MRADEYRKSLAMADYYAEKARVERQRQATERRIMGGGYQPTPKNTPVSTPVVDPESDTPHER